MLWHTSTHPRLRSNSRKEALERWRYSVRRLPVCISRLVVAEPDGWCSNAQPMQGLALNLYESLFPRIPTTMTGDTEFAGETDANARGAARRGRDLGDE